MCVNMACKWLMYKNTSKAFTISQCVILTCISDVLTLALMAIVML